MTVTVVDLDEEGGVSLSRPQPQAERPFSASLWDEDEGVKSCVEAVERWGKNVSGEIKEVVGREAERRLAEDASPDGTLT